MLGTMLEAESSGGSNDPTRPKLGAPIQLEVASETVS